MSAVQVVRGARTRLVVGTDRHHVALGLRTGVLCAAMVLLLLVLALVGLALGDYPVPPREVLDVVLGRADGLAPTVVLEWRLPRVAAAIGFGAALAVSGAIFQTLTRNPLASPDIVGLSSGAYTGMLVVLLVLGGGWAGMLAGALAGGLGAAALIALLAARGGLQGFRFIVVGIGVSAMLSAVNTWLILRADLETAMLASAWGVGSLNTATLQVVPSALVAVALLLLVVPWQAPALTQLQLGDDIAATSGVSVPRARAGLVVVAVALVAVVTTVAGPVAFVALSAPQIARRLARTPHLPLVPTALVGAVLLLGADLVAQHVIPQTVPVGLVTVVFGGGYLLWLLLREARRTDR